MRIIGTVIPSITDSCSFYRGIGPLSEMAKKSDIMIHTMERFNWASMSQLSCLFMQRPYDEKHVEILEQALFNNIPIWVDYDDLLLEMPTDNPSWFLYQKPKVRASIEYCIKNASVVTVSTKYLADKIKHLNPSIVVIPNAMDIDRYPYRGKMEIGKLSRSFLWRGSRTHMRDLVSYADEILESQKVSAEWKYHFIGDNAWPITDRMPDERCYVMEPMKIEDYMMHIWRLAPSCGLVPLHDSPFNRAKSNIAWMEYAFAGAVTIAPSWEEWAQPGVLCYNNPKEFLNAMTAVISGDIDAYENSKQAWEYICDNLSLAKVNVMRRQIVERLLS